jgi:hypothetical protein
MRLSPQQRYYRRNRKKILTKQRKHRKADVNGIWRARRVRIVAEHVAYVAAIKMEAGCVDCGYRDHPAALDFDHLDPLNKRCQVSAMAGRLKADIEAEIAKCEVVCANCHRIRTFNRRRTQCG